MLRLPTLSLGRNRRGAAPAEDDEAALRERIHRRVRSIEIRSHSLLRDQFAGEYRSAFRGRGLEFAQIRAYLPGDDVRFIDWNVTARRGAPFIKQYVEERERTVLLLVDVSASAAFGTVGRSVRSYAVEIAGLIGYAAALSKDRVGAVAFSDRVEYTLPPKRNARHVSRLLHDLLVLRPEGRGTDLGRALDYVDRLVRRGSIIFVISDFLASDGSAGEDAVSAVGGEGGPAGPRRRRGAEWEGALRRLVLRHDVTALVVQDPHAAAVPSGGMFVLEDSEAGQTRLVDGHDAARRLDAAASARRAELTRQLRTAGADFLFLSSDEEYLHKLTTLFRARMHRQ